MATTEAELFGRVTQKNYAEQAKFFLNAYWDEVKDDVETIYQYAQKFAQIDTEKRAAGSDIDELKAHIFLEGVGAFFMLF